MAIVFFVPGKLLGVLQSLPNYSGAVVVVRCGVGVGVGSLHCVNYRQLSSVTLCCVNGCRTQNVTNGINFRPFIRVWKFIAAVNNDKFVKILTVSIIFTIN